MNFLDFFDKDKQLNTIKLPGAQVGCHLTTSSENSYVYEEPDNSQMTLNYAEKYRNEEEKLCLENMNMREENDNLLRPDTPTTCQYDEDNDIYSDISENVYSKYKFDHYIQKPNLSINFYQEQVLNVVNSNSVVVIQGPTGCGKTTQVPQYILDHHKAQNKYCKIAVTQPRRIAAISVAKRVSEERGWPLGSIVGYQVGLDNKTSEDSILIYMTTGVLLQKLIQNKNLNHFTHIIIDEIHERDADMDFLLLIVRRFLRTVSTVTKVVLMSATIDVEHFAKYFRVPRGSHLVTAPIIDITKSQQFQVSNFYLNQLTQLLDTFPEFNRDEPILHHCLFQLVLKLLRIFDNFDARKSALGSVLIFLPGIYEIQELYDLLEKQNREWILVPLHSSITIEEQRNVFLDPPSRRRKVILSTNIAESSITVPDVVYVIDFCLTKILQCDNATNYSSLKLSWASHTNCIQRSGRVGRVSNGRVYRLVPENFYNNCMQRDIEPEILRSPLHRLVLLSKMLELDLPPHSILALAIDQPPLEKIEQTIAMLKEAGGLLITTKGEYDQRDGDVTYIGRIMAHLPLDIHISKLIILGYMFSTLKECVIMAAAMTLQNIFNSPFQERMKAYQSKLSWADCSCSDLIAYLHVYCVWERKKYNNLFRIAGGEKVWMKRNFLQPKIMNEWRILVQEIKQRLNNLGITEPLQGRQANLTEHEKAMMLKIVISGAFYPNYFVRSCEGGQIDESMAVRQIGGRDPFNTVYLTGKLENQPIELYVHSIRELLKECGKNMLISHDNSNKIYIQFKRDVNPTNYETGENNPLIPGKIGIEIYNAVKFRHNKVPNIIKCIPSEEAHYRVRQWKKQQEQIKKELECNTIINSIIPGFEISIIEIRISFVNNPGHFYAHNVENMEVMQMLNKLEDELNNTSLEDIDSEIFIGKLYAAPFEGKFYRAKVLSLVTNISREQKVQLMFVDYGNVSTISKIKLKKLLPHMLRIPPLALECVLAYIQPSTELNVHACWTKQATEEFIRLTSGGTRFGKIYSIIDNVIYLELYMRQQAGDDPKTINQVLIDKKFAQISNESFLSQDDHKKREFAQSNSCAKNFYNSYIEWFDQTNEMPPLNPNECRMSMKLQGPFSPLEMKVFGILQCNLQKSISVEWNSVNSVLLDTDPQNPHDRLLVAGSINQTVDCSRLTLRHTTMMPNINGFPALMAILFAPKMEIHTNKEGERITSILCGIGYDPITKKSYYSAHDLALNLDFELTDDLITKLNEIRYFMNNAVIAMSSYKTDVEPPMAMESCQNEIRKGIRQLLKIKLNLFERELITNIYQWGSLCPNVEVTRPLHMDKDVIWSMHSFVKLHDQEKAKVKKHLSDLRDIANKVKQMTEIVCNICDTTLYDITQVRIHITSEKHKQNEKKYI